jgi:hypothetical protein
MSFCVFVVLCVCLWYWVGPRASRMLSKCWTPEPHSSPAFLVLNGITLSFDLLNFAGRLFFFFLFFQLN